MALYFQNLMQTLYCSDYLDVSYKIITKYLGGKYLHKDSNSDIAVFEIPHRRNSQYNFLIKLNQYHIIQQWIIILKMDKSSQKPKEHCQICKKKFGGVFSSQHQCKRCLRTICKQCCTKKKYIFTKSNTKIQEHRCCDMCWPQSQHITNYIKNNSLIFNNISMEGKQWSQLSQIDVSDNKNPSSIKNRIQFKSFNDVWANLTPSLRELSGMLISKISIPNVEALIKNVCDKASITANISQSLIPLIIYLLCHCDVQNSIKIFNYLISIGQNVSQKAINENITLLCRDKQLKVDPKIQSNLINFAKNVYKSFTYLYFLNSLQLDVVHFVIIQTLLSGDPKILELLFSCLIFDHRQYVLTSKYEDKILKNMIWQSTSLKNTQKSIKKLRKSILKTNGVQTKQEQKVLQIEIKQKMDKKIEEEPQPQNKNQEKVIEQKQEAILQKINQAEQFIKKMQSLQLNDEQTIPQDIQSLQKYLDLIIQQNDQSLKQCEQFDKLLLSIQDQLYKKNQK